jgi:ribose/xylose/arabinose/galactoside ABC-type transport system permease subunit
LTARSYFVYVAFLGLLVFFAIRLHDDGFLSQTNLLNIVRQTTPVTVMAVAVVFVLSAGEIDLSLSAVVALSALVTGDVNAGPRRSSGCGRRPGRWRRRRRRQRVARHAARGSPRSW